MRGGNVGTLASCDGKPPRVGKMPLDSFNIPAFETLNSPITLDNDMTNQLYGATCRTRPTRQVPRGSGRLEHLPGRPSAWERLDNTTSDSDDTTTLGTPGHALLHKMAWRCSNHGRPHGGNAPKHPATFAWDSARLARPQPHSGPSRAFPGPVAVCFGTLPR